MILSDTTIKSMILANELLVEPGPGQTQQEILERTICASIDLQLGNEFKFFPQLPNQVLNPFEQDTKDITEHMTVEDGKDIRIEPGQFLLAATKERFGLPANIVGRVEGRSSLGRLGLIIHVTAGFIDPGFGRDHPSTITLEITNINSLPIIIKPGMRICQMAFELLDQPSEMPYNKKKGAKYNGQQSPQESRLHLNG